MVTNIKVGELRRVIRESKDEFKPVVFGDKETKKINDEAYSDIKKETEKYDGGVGKKSEADATIHSDGLGMHDLRFDDISKPFKDKVKSQMKGYVSKDAEDKHKDDEFGNSTFDNDGKIYNAAKEHAEKKKEGRDKASEIGLTGREIDKKEIEKNDTTMYESKNIKRLNFKNTTFLSEGHMMTKVPDEYKVDGNKFIMRDSSNNEYLVEWNSKEPNVTKKVNMNLVNEEKDRIKQLWNYKSAEGKTSTNGFRIQEDKEFSNMVNKARELMK